MSQWSYPNLLMLIASATAARADAKCRDVNHTVTYCRYRLFNVAFIVGLSES